MNEETDLEWILDEGILPPKEKRGPFHCNFCGKSNKEVKKIIAGPSVFICNECVGLCVDIMGEDSLPLSVQAEGGPRE